MSSPTDPPAAPSPPSAETPAGTPPSATRPIVRRSGRRTLLSAVVVVAVAAIVVGAGYETSWFGLVTHKKSYTVDGAGASFLLPLISKWESEWDGSYSSYQLVYTSDGAGTGITRFTQNLEDFAATDEPLTSAQVTALPGTTLTLPVTGGPVAVVTNIPGFTGTLDLNATQLIAIYSGTVTTWGNTLLTGNNAGLNGSTTAIVPVVRSDAAGTTYVLTNYLSDNSSAWASSVGTSIQPTWPKVTAEQAESGNSGLAAYVAKTPGAIGYCDLPDANKNHLQVAGVLNPSGAYIVPTVANTQSAIDDYDGPALPSATGDWSDVSWVDAPGAADYPLATLSYFLILENPAIGYDPSLENAQALVNWVEWSITTGQQYAGPLDYDVPPTALLTQDAAALCDVNYNGAPVETCA